ncbi:multicopper oxidase family protein [Mycobacterium sp. ML4]
MVCDCSRMLDRREFMRAGALGSAGLAATLLAACSHPASGSGGTLKIDLTAQPADIDLGGVVVRTWVWGNQLPGKEIRLRKGQRFSARLTNRLPHDTTVHWHGLAIPNSMDGVPVLTQPAVTPGQGFHYEFTVPDAGTYWAHSHVGVQTDRGLYAPLIIEDPAAKADYDDELVIVLDDWIDGTGTNPDEVFANLQKNGMKPMAMKPGGGVSPTTPIGADGGDVTYRYFILNGKLPKDAQAVNYRPGQRIRLRVINAGGDTAFRVAVPGTALTLTHTDGYPVIPQQSDAVILGMGERFDAIITVGQSPAPIVAVPEMKDGYALLNMRVNGRLPAVDVDNFVATVRGQAVLDTASLKPAPEVTLPAMAPQQVLELRLSGPVDGYSWPINGRRYDPPNNPLDVTAGHRVRLRLINESMMYHPIHLHGHTFEVQAGDGTPRARKDTVLVPPMQTVEVDFDTDNPGRWITHCHNTYHLEAGMATFIRYRS